MTVRVDYQEVHRFSTYEYIKDYRPGITNEMLLQELIDEDEDTFNHKIVIHSAMYCGNDQWKVWYSGSYMINESTLVDKFVEKDWWNVRITGVQQLPPPGPDSFNPEPEIFSSEEAEKAFWESINE